MSPRRSFASPASSSPQWPTEPCDDPAAEKIRLFVINLTEAIRLGEPDSIWSLRSLARHVGMDHSLLSDLIAGSSWPSSLTIAQLEVALDTQLWRASSRTRPCGPRSGCGCRWAGPAGW